MVVTFYKLWLFSDISDNSQSCVSGNSWVTKTGYSIQEGSNKRTTASINENVKRRDQINGPRSSTALEDFTENNEGESSKLEDRETTSLASSLAEHCFSDPVKCTKWISAKQGNRETNLIFDGLFLDDELQTIPAGIEDIFCPTSKCRKHVEKSNGRLSDRREKWAEHFKQLIDTTHTGEWNASLSHPPEQEIECNICQLECEKAPGPSGLYPVHLNEDVGPRFTHLTKLVGAIGGEEKRPAKWSTYILISIFIMGKRSRCDNHRGTGLVAVAPRVLPVLSFKGCLNKAIDKLPDVRIFVSNVKGSTAQHIEWTSKPMYPRGCDLRYRLTRYAKQLSTQKISQTFVIIQNITTENLLPETTYVYIAIVYSQKLGFHFRKSTNLTARTNRRSTTIAIRGVKPGNGFVKIKWNKISLGANVQVRVIDSKSEFIVKGTRISNRIENLTACTAYSLWIELMNGKTEINRLWLGNVTTKYPGWGCSDLSGGLVAAGLDTVRKNGTAVRPRRMYGTAGCTKTYDLLRQRAYWPGMRSEVMDYVVSCKRCQLMKGDTTGATHPMEPIPVSEIGELWSVDVMGPFPVTTSGNQYIVIMTEHLSRWIEAAAVPNQRATTISGVPTTGKSPFMLMYGRHPRLPVDQEIGLWPTTRLSPEELDEERRKARENLTAVQARTRQKTASGKARSFPIGAKVKWKDHQNPGRSGFGSRKLGSRWQGPFVVTDRRGNVYTIQDVRGSKRVNGTQLRKWHDTPEERPSRPAAGADLTEAHYDGIRFRISLSHRVKPTYPVLKSPDGFTVEQLENRMGHRLQWFPISTNLSLTCQLSYRVTRIARIRDNTEEKHFTLVATQLNLFDLQPNVRYFYKVQVVLNSVHYGRYSDSIRIDTPPTISGSEYKVIIGFSDPPENSPPSSVKSSGIKVVTQASECRIRNEHGLNQRVTQKGNVNIDEPYETTELVISSLQASSSSKEPSKPLEPHVSLTDGGLVVQWTGRLNPAEQINKVQILCVNDGELVQKIMPATALQLVVNMSPIQWDLRVLFAVENFVGLSPFISVSVPKLPGAICNPQQAEHRLAYLLYAPSIPKDLRMRSFKNTLAHSLIWNPVSSCCNTVYRVETVVHNRAGTVSKHYTETHQTELHVNDVRAETTYKYRVQSMNANNGTSDFSSWIIFRTPGLPTVRFSVQVYPGHRGTMIISWAHEMYKLHQVWQLVFILLEAERQAVFHVSPCAKRHTVRIKSPWNFVRIYAAAQNAVGLSSFYPAKFVSCHQLSDPTHPNMEARNIILLQRMSLCISGNNDGRAKVSAATILEFTSDIEFLQRFSDALSVSFVKYLVKRQAYDSGASHKNIFKVVCHTHQGEDTKKDSNLIKPFGRCNRKELRGSDKSRQRNSLPKRVPSPLYPGSVRCEQGDLALRCDDRDRPGVSNGQAQQTFSIKKARRKIKHTPEDLPREARKMGPSNSREEARNKLPVGDRASSLRVSPKRIFLGDPAQRTSGPKRHHSAPSRPVHSRKPKEPNERILFENLKTATNPCVQKLAVRMLNAATVSIFHNEGKNRVSKQQSLHRLDSHGAHYPPHKRTADSYSVFRAASKTVRAEGFCILVDDRFPQLDFALRYHSCICFFHALWIRISLCGTVLFLGVICRCPPQSPPEEELFLVQTNEQKPSSYNFTDILPAAIVNKMSSHSPDIELVTTNPTSYQQRMTPPCLFSFVIDGIMRRTLDGLQNTGVQLVADQSEAQAQLNRLTTIIPSFGMRLALSKCKVMLQNVQSMNISLKIQRESLEIVEIVSFFPDCLIERLETSQCTGIERANDLKEVILRTTEMCSDTEFKLNQNRKRAKSPI
ncbi:gypsy retrotransposon integrase-like protein 1, partial [Clonorchis sinensis]